EAAFQRFVELGFPTTHDEEWRFTNVARLAGSGFQPAAALPGGAQVPEEAQSYLAQYAGYDRNAFVALNTAFLNEVSFHQVSRGTVAERPIEITHQVASGAAFHPRTLIVVGANAQCTIVETFRGTGSYFTNAVTEIVAGENSVIDHYKVQLESPVAFHIATMQATLGRNANFASHSIALGGALVRNDANATLSEGTEATLNGLYVVKGRQHVDNHTQIDHAKPHGTSHELYKGILDGHASAVFNGRIIVRKDA